MSVLYQIMADFNSYIFYEDAKYLEHITQPFSIRFNALRELFEYIREDPAARYCFASGWVDFIHPIITLELVLMGKEIKDND